DASATARHGGPAKAQLHAIAGVTTKVVARISITETMASRIGVCLSLLSRTMPLPFLAVKPRWNGLKSMPLLGLVR
ncbi:MAG: hypothetical protein ACRD6I_18595, partial [Candidatus Acidiferrales bacterium]